MNDSRQPPFRPEKHCCLDGSVLHALSAPGMAIAGFLLLGSFLIGCDRQDTPKLSQERRTAVADTVRSLIRTAPFPDPAPYLQLFAKDAPFYTEGARFSRAEHEKRVHKMVEASSAKNIELNTDPEVDVLGPRSAVASMLLRGQVTDTAGERRKISGGAITFVFQLRDGEWKVVQAHESSAPGQSP